MLDVVAGAVQLSKLVLRQVLAVYMFSDSTLDVGNNDHLPGEEVPRAGKPYYDVDLPGSGKPTRRLSNGYNVADFVGTLFLLVILEYQCIFCRVGFF
jgi:hypothetical protein